MKRRLLLWGILFWMILLVTTPAWAEGDPSKIVLGYEPGQSTEKVEVLLTDGATQAEVPLFVTYAADEALKDVLFYASVRDKDGRIVTSGVLQFLDPRQDNASLSRIDLEPGTGARQIVLRLQDFTAFGTFTGFVAAEVGGNSIRVTSLEVRRPAQPLLRIQEAGEGTEFSLTSFGPQLDDSFFLLETSGQGESQQLNLSVAQLRSSGGRAANVTLQPSELTLKPYLAERIRVTGTLPEVGEFHGLLTLTYGDRQRTYTLVTKRERAQAHLALEAIAPPPMTHVLPSPVTATIRLDLSETAGGQAEFDEPTLQKLVQAGTGTDRPEARYRSCGLRDRCGGAIVPEAADGEPTVLTLAPAQPRQMTLVVQGLNASGQYEGTVQVATPGGAVISDTFTLFVKDQWFFPAIAILLGALSSYALRHWLQIGRPQLLEEAAIRRTLNRIEEAIPDDQDLIRRALVERLSELLETNRLTPGTDVDAELKQVGAMLNNYLVIRDVLALRDRLDQLVPDGEEQKGIRQRLNDIDNTLHRRRLDALQNDDPGKNAQVKAAEEIRADLMKAAAKSISGAVTELRTALKQQRASLKERPPSAQREDLDRRLREVEKLINQVDTIAARSREATGERAIQLLREAREAYNQARRRWRYQALRVDRLRLTVEAQTETPLGFEQGKWTDISQRLLERLPADRSADAYEEARIKYLPAVQPALQKKAQENAQTVTGIPDIQDKAGVFETIAVSAEGTLSRVESDPDQAQAEYAQWQKDYQNAVEEVKRVKPEVPLGEKGEAPQNPAAPPGGAGPREVGEPPQPPSQPIEVPDLSTLLARIQRNDRLALLIVSGVSVRIGLQPLWGPRNDFGGLVDYVIGFFCVCGVPDMHKVAFPAAASQMSPPWFPAGENQNQ